MARSLQLLSLVLSRARAAAPCPLSTFTLPRSRLVNKGPNIQLWACHRAPRHRDEEYDGEHELEDVEDKIRDVIDKEVRRRKTVKYHIMRRQMTPRGPPERALTWEAIETIRHLRQEHPEEWTVERLAEGFSVSKDIIHRVLRNKYVASPERKAKQDAKVMSKLKQHVLPSGLQTELKKHRLTSGPTRLALLSGSENSALIPRVHQSLIPQTEQNPVALSVVTKHEFSEIRKHSTGKTQEEIQQSTESTEAEEEEEEEEEDWDGQVLSEEDIEELITVKATPVVKEGNDFFDVNGNFLYRI